MGIDIVSNGYVAYIGWALYYVGIATSGVILLLTIAPCAAFLLFAIERKNLPAIILAIGFTVCHVVFGIVNYVI